MTQKREIVVLETTVNGVECSEKNGVMVPSVGLLIRGGLPRGFTPIIVQEVKDQECKSRR